MVHSKSADFKLEQDSFFVFAWPVLQKGLKKWEWENVIGHDTVQTEYIKQQLELLQNENNRLPYSKK